MSVDFCVYKFEMSNSLHHASVPIKVTMEELRPVGAQRSDLATREDGEIKIFTNLVAIDSLHMLWI